MMNLYVNDVHIESDQDVEEIYHRRHDVHNDIDRALRKVLLDSKFGGDELKSWLIESVSSLMVRDTMKFDAFCDLIRHRDRDLLLHLMQMICRDDPVSTGNAIKRCHWIFKSFFREKESRILDWFGHFTEDGNFKFGAKTLEKYVFINSYDRWTTVLKWKKDKLISPMMAAAKKQSFSKLDVVESVHRLLRDDHFWMSEEFEDSVATGEIIPLDYDFFAEELLIIFNSRNCPRPIEDLIYEYIENTPFLRLCELLHKIDDRSLFRFIKDLNFESSNYLKSFVFSFKWDKFEDILFYNALLEQFRNRTVRYFLEEENLSNFVNEKIIIHNDQELKDDLQIHWKSRKYLNEAEPIVKLKFILFESIIILTRFKYEEISKKQLERLMTNEGIPYKKIYSKIQKKRRTTKESDKKISKVFMGWRLFPEDKIKNQKRKRDLVYSVNDLPNTLTEVFLEAIKNTN